MIGCLYCGGWHRSRDCRVVEGGPAILETPPHNGLYRGRAQVITLAPGVMGSDLGGAGGAALRSARKGRERQHRLAVARKRKKGRARRGPTKWGRPWG